MPLPYTGPHGEQNFEADFIALLQQSGWEKQVLKNYCSRRVKFAKLRRSKNANSGRLKFANLSQSKRANHKISTAQIGCSGYG